MQIIYGKKNLVDWSGEAYSKAAIHLMGLTYMKKNNATYETQLRVAMYFLHFNRS